MKLEGSGKYKIKLRNKEECRDVQLALFKLGNEWIDNYHLGYDSAELQNSEARFLYLKNGVIKCAVFDKGYFEFDKSKEIFVKEIIGKKSNFLKKPTHLVVWEELIDPYKFFTSEKEANEFVKELSKK